METFPSTEPFPSTEIEPFAETDTEPFPGSENDKVPDLNLHQDDKSGMPNPWGDNRRNSSLESRRSWFKSVEKIGSYQLIKVIGTGGIGQVRKVKHIETSQKFALKTIAMDQNKKKFIKREIAISRILHHPNIITMHEAIFENFDKEVHMIFDYIDGSSLLDYIISHTFLTEKVARPFFRQILSAIEYCHLNGIVHRDLKIENILIDKNGQVKLIDFGLATLYNPNEFLLTNCGSIFFAAPELLHKYPYVGPEVDIWSLGVVLFVMLTGKVPFEDKNIPGVYAKIKAGLIKWPTDIVFSTSAKALIEWMLTVDRKGRASLSDVLNHEWVNESYPHPPKCEKPERTLITKIDPAVVKKMGEFGFTEEEIYQEMKMAIELKKDPHEIHPIRSMYYMTAEKIKREEERRDSQNVSVVIDHDESTVSVNSNSATNEVRQRSASNFSKFKLSKKKQTDTTVISASTSPSPAAIASSNQTNTLQIPGQQQSNKRASPRPRSSTVGKEVDRQSILKDINKETSFNNKSIGADAQQQHHYHTESQKEGIKIPVSEKVEMKQVPMKGLFSVSTTSSKAAFLIRDEIERVLGNLKITYQTKGFDITCTHLIANREEVILEEGANNELKFEISIVRVQLLNVNGLLMKKLSGDPWIYKSICDQILQLVKL